MLSDKFKEVIKFVCSKLEHKEVKWAIVGSTNMALHGIDVNPNDIDIVTNPGDLKIFEEVFQEYVVKPICKKAPYKQGFPEFYELKLDIKGIEVHIFGEYDTDVYYSKVSRGKVVLVNLDDIKIPCLSLESEADAYSETDREHKAKLIRNFLKRHKKFANS